MLPTCALFVRSEDGNLLLVVALAANKFGQRPSMMIGIDDDQALALDFDIAAAIKLQQWQDEREIEKWKM
jgi:hypothetical protein